MSFCADCFKAVVHEGTPKGEMVEIGGVQCYVAMPNVEYPKDKVVLFLTDACGLGLPNNKLLADDFARNGFKTIVPDLFSGDAVPESAFEPDAPPFDWQKWVTRHGAAETRPLLDAMVAALQDQHGVVAMAGTGYCFGGRYVFDLALEGIITVAAVAHPSLLKAPDDFEKYLATATAPLLINSCTIDQAFPPEMQAQADTILGGGAFVPGYKRVYFEGCTHGFAVKGDMNDPKVKAGKEGAFKATVDWFLEYL